MGRKLGAAGIAIALIGGAAGHARAATPAPTVIAQRQPKTGFAVPYRTRGLWIVDGYGRRLLLRGVDVSGAEFTPTDRPLPYGPADFEAIRASGATVVRIPIAWALLEPSPGSFDAAALARVAEVVGWAGQAGLLVVLDMHQYEWSPCFGGNGMPAWATSPCPAVATGTPALAEAAPAETAFWRSTSLQEDFAAAWVRVAETVGSPPWLLGYDILNEPPNGLLPPGVFETEVLPSFYRAVGTALRSVDPRALLFVEPALTHSAASPASSFLGPIGLGGVVYAPHEYGTTLDDASGDTADIAGPVQFAPDLDIVKLQASRMQAALWVGEWGDVNTTSPTAYRSGAYVPDMIAAQDAAMVGSAYWTYWRTGWPYTQSVASQLARITPFAVSGMPLSLASGVASARLEWRSAGGTTLVSLPAGSRPTVEVVSGHVRWKQIGSGWLALRAPAGTEASVRVVSGRHPDGRR